MTFALDLSHRFFGNEVFHVGYRALQRQATVRTLSMSLSDPVEKIEEEMLWKLLYCADVFVQTDDAKYRGMAQAIALNTLLIDHDADARERSLRVLTDLGNFPAITYVRENYTPDAPTQRLTDVLRLALSRELNSIDVGVDRIALTDFQKETWDGLPKSRSLAISAPTSAGKSFLVIEHLCREIALHPEFTAVYIAPTRALLSEVFDTISNRLAGEEGVRISTVPTPNVDAARQIFVLTQERLQVLLAVTDMSFDLVVVDEAQNLSDGSRGMILQECLEQVLGRSEATRMLMLAPGAEGFDEVGRAIGKPDLPVAYSLLPSVVQNRIIVTKSAKKNSLNLRLLTDAGPETLGTITGQRGFDLPATRLAAVALELGSSGGSLVYSTGPSDSEGVALQIYNGLPPIKNETLDDLAEFIEKHIHPRYGLANLVRRGVAFHYGKMPTLLREALEGAFKAGNISFLACTTTLFQGVNLPARNVFIDTPKRGAGKSLDPAAMWNFAGRAGRMRRDIVGNVFLVDYDDWPAKPMDSFVGYKIEPAFGRAMTEALPRVHDALSGAMPAVSRHDEQAQLVRSAAGLLISRAARGDVRQFVDRTLRNVGDVNRALLVAASERAQDDIALPPTLLATNWTVDPFGLRRLYDDLNRKIEDGSVNDLIPINPHDDVRKANDRYTSIFMRAQRLVNGVDNRFAAVVAGTAVQWMRGVAYPVLLARAVDKAEKNYEEKMAANAALRKANPNARVRDPKPVDVNSVIRKQFDMIEDVIRFQYVQLGNAYMDILKLALLEQGQEERLPELYPFPLALELGIATQSGWSFMELGLSRIAASALEPHFPNSSLTAQQAREWLQGVDVATLRLNPVILDELRKLKLVGAAA
jgi:hypothetical protein